jgi:hypothetical protein
MTESSASGQPQPGPQQPGQHPSGPQPGQPPAQPQLPPAPFPPAPQAGWPPAGPSPYAAPPQPYPGVRPKTTSTWKIFAIVIVAVLGSMALGLIVLAGVCFGGLSLLGS